MALGSHCDLAFACLSTSSLSPLTLVNFVKITPVVPLFLECMKLLLTSFFYVSLSANEIPLPVGVYSYVPRGFLILNDVYILLTPK